MNTKKIPPQPSRINTGSIENLIKVYKVHLNLSQEVIITTEDKIKLRLSEHLKRMEKRKSWIAPLGILLAITVTLVTSSFKDVGLNSATWKAIFIITGVISFGWLMYSVWEACHSKKMIDIISELKKDSTSMENR